MAERAAPAVLFRGRGVVTLLWIAGGLVFAVLVLAWGLGPEERTRVDERSLGERRPGERRLGERQP